MTDGGNFWKRCSSCKKELPFSGQYYACSVSTCRHPRKGFQFCSVPCWDAHLGYANHREAWAVEETAPAFSSAINNQSTATSARTAKRTIVPDKKSAPSPMTGSAGAIETDTLIVVSKVKKLIKDQSGYNTSQCCIDALTKKVVAECLRGIENAKKSERKTVMGRDI